MTITYQFNVATSAFFGFTKLLFKWRGSVYKLVHKEILIYMTAFGLISFSYRVLMTEPQRRIFEKVSLHCGRYLDLIPLSFVLGFYVTYIVQRWWSQFTTIPWPDRLMNTIILYVEGTDERGRMIRRTLMRYWNLSFVMILSSISIAVKKRFPTLEHLVEAGFMTYEERQYFEHVKAKINKYFIPMCWFLRLLDQAKKEGRVKDGAAMKHILEELNDTRTKMSLLWCHDWVTMPLVYTQVVTWAAHLFFVACLVGRQFLDPLQGYRDHDIDLYVPIFTLLQFFFYMGWLKVAEQLINPFGEDDDDFETNWLIDRHIQVSYLGVDELYVKTPPLEKDLYWNSKEPDVPYTPSTLIHRIPTYCGSTMHLKISEKDQPMVHNDDIPPDFSPTQSKGILERIKEFCHCGEPRPFTFSTMWKDTNENSEIELSQKIAKPLYRTLGRKESLMSEEFLVMLNSGQKRYRVEPSHLQQGGFQYADQRFQSSFGEMSDVALQMPERRISTTKQPELGMSFRAGSSLSMKYDGNQYRDEILHRQNSSRFSYYSQGDEEDGGTIILDDVTRSHPLTRLSEVENETDGDISSNSALQSPMESPFNSINNTTANANENEQHEKGSSNEGKKQ